MRPKNVRPEDAPGTVQSYSKTCCHGCDYRIRRGRTGPSGPRRNGADIIEDAEWLAETGENMEAAARRLGYASADSLARSLWRWGRGDLCTKFAPLYEVAS